VGVGVGVGVGEGVHRRWRSRLSEGSGEA